MINRPLFALLLAALPVQAFGQTFTCHGFEPMWDLAIGEREIVYSYNDTRDRKFRYSIESEALLENANPAAEMGFFYIGRGKTDEIYAHLEPAANPEFPEDDFQIAFRFSGKGNTFRAGSCKKGPYRPARKPPAIE